MIECNAVKENTCLVEALDTYKKNSIQDNILGFVPEPGYQFRVSKERLEVLLGKNGHGLVFVKLVEEPKVESKPKKTEKKKKTK